MGTALPWRCGELLLAGAPTWAPSLAWTVKGAELGKDKNFPLVLAALEELERAHLASKVSKNRKLSLTFL